MTTGPAAGIRLNASQDVLDWLGLFWDLKGGDDHLAVFDTQRTVPDHLRLAYFFSGFAGEIFTAWFYGLQWPAIIVGAGQAQRDDEQDVGQRTQVRSIVESWKNLFVRDYELAKRPDHRWGLVYVNPNGDWARPSLKWTGTLVGWCLSRDVPVVGARNATCDAISRREGVPRGWIVQKAKLDPFDSLDPCEV